MDFFIKKINLLTRIIFFSVTFTILLHFVSEKPLQDRSFAAINVPSSELSYSPEFSVTERIFLPYEPIRPRDQRALALENYLVRQGSYLAQHTDLIVDLSDQYGVDYKLLPAIAGVESGYCKINFRPNNCWGFGQYGWDSPEEALSGYMELMNKGYFSLGLTTVETIARKYNPTPDEYIRKVYIHLNQMSGLP